VRSKDRKNRGVSAAAGSETPADDGSVFAAQPATGPPADEPDGLNQANGGGHSGRRTSTSKKGHAAPQDAPSGRRALKNWRVRSRLMLLVAIPTATALAFGGYGIYSSIQSAQAYQQVHQLAQLGQDNTRLAQALQDERDQTVFYIALGDSGGRSNGLSSDASVRADANPELAVIHQQYTQTNQDVATVTKLAGQVGGGYTTQTQQAASTVLQALATLDSLRTSSISSQLPLLVVVQQYSNVISDVLGFNNDIAQGVGDPQLAQTVDVLGLVSQMKADASVQRAILTAALQQGSFAPGELTALQGAMTAQATTLQAFNTAATPAQITLWNNSVSKSSGFSQTSSEEIQAVGLATTGSGSGSLGNDPTTPDDWYASMTTTIHSQMGAVEQSLAGSVISRAASLRTRAITIAAIVGAAVLIVLALAMLFTVIVGRSMVRPLRRLRSDALTIAGVRLPDMVRRLSESDGDEGEFEVRPIGVDSTDEIGQVARAFDQVHAEAVRLASNEARLRGNVNAMFVNLSRRSQSLVERQIHLIDDLEQGEQDSDRLGSLFRLDHLATRMRRNSENLLVLAGHEAARRWTQPVALVDVLRAAVSEIEHYERVTLNVQPGIAVRGQVVNDVVHLLAELVENATAFSSEQTQVNVSGHLLNSGGVLLDITDQGVGMAGDEMADANWRLDNPPMVDVAVSRRMGLFVVARLASRHGIRVRLRPAASGGLTALIWLPDETVTHEVAGLPTALRRFELDTPAALTPEGPARLSAADLDPRSAAEAAVAEARTPRFTAFETPGDDGQPYVPPQGGEPDADDAPSSGEPPLPVRNKNPLPVRTPNNSLPARGTNGPLPVRGTNGLLRGDQPSAGQDRTAEPRTSEPLFGAPTGLAGAGTGADTDLGHGAGIGTGAGIGAGTGNGAASDDERWPIWRPAEESDPGLGLEPWPDPRSAESTAANPAMPSADEMPAAPASAVQDNRLPIFESVESDWFRRGRQQASAAGDVDGNSDGDGDGMADIAAGWSSPADEGWLAAEAADTPSTDGTTSVGLPRRAPRANLVPGSAQQDERVAVPGLVRSASATRERMASFQRGSREGRAALQSDDAPLREEEDAT
jgi:signal transduction histidine kinase